MVRNLKRIGLFLGAVLALSAVAPLAASAQQGKIKTENGGAVTLTVKQTGTQKNIFTAFGGKLECLGSEYTGHKVGGTELIPDGSTEVTLTPQYSTTCHVPIGVTPYTATVNPNGCDYVFKIGNTTGEQSGTKKTYGLTADIVCPDDKEIVATIYEITDPKHENAPWCTISIPAQTGLTGPHLISEAPWIYPRVEGEFKGIKATLSGTKQVICPTGTITTTSATLHTELKIEAQDKDKKLEGVQIVD